MKRDMDLIRELMLRLEAYPMPPGAFRHFEGHDEELAVPGCDPKGIAHHLTMIAGSGFIDTGDSEPSYGIGFKGLTWAGSDFVDSVRDPEIWRQTQKGLEKIKGFTVELAVSIAKGIAKKKVFDLLGIDLG
jgi:hypothetical protein